MVELEGRLRGVNGNGDGANCGDGGLESPLVTCLHVHEAGVVSANVVLVEVAFLVLEVQAEWVDREA